MTIVVAAPGAKTATWSWCGAVYLNDGSIVATSGQGTSQESSKHKWKFNGTVSDSLGRTAAVESEGDFATQTWAGRIFEWS